MGNRYELIPTPKPDEENANTIALSTTHPQPVSTQFTLRRMACFGSPKFDRREPLHILSADSRFPDIEPRKIRKVGNHFLALFPVEDEKKNRIWIGNKDVKLRRHALIRGGTNDRLKEEEETEKARDYNKREEESDSAKVDRWDGGRGSWST